MRRKLKTYEMGRLSEQDFKKASKIPVCLFLDDVRSLLNVGSLFRTSDAFLVDKIFLSGITAAPPSREMEKTALGATKTVDWEITKDPIQTLEKLKARGYVLCALEQTEGSVMLQDFKIDSEKKYILILGNEAHGVQQNIINRCDYVIEIPQAGTKHSLNVSVSGGMLLWEFFKALK